MTGLFLWLRSQGRWGLTVAVLSDNRVRLDPQLAKLPAGDGLDFGRARLARFRPLGDRPDLCHPPVHRHQPNGRLVAVLAVPTLYAGVVALRVVAKLRVESLVRASVGAMLNANHVA